MSPSLLYLKPLRNGNTFLHVIYKSKKKTNFLCILNDVFQYSKIRTRKRNAKKSIKTEKKLESSPFWNPESTELESGIQYSESGIHRVESRIQDCHGFPYMGDTTLKFRLTFLISINSRSPREMKNVHKGILQIIPNNYLQMPFILVRLFNLFF